MNIEDIAQRYSRLDGFHLADYCTVALPFWFVAYEAQVLAEKPIALVDEFLLRTIQAHVDTVSDLAAFLGIGEKITIRRLGGLHSGGHIQVLPAKANTQAAYELTRKGDAALRDLASIQPKEKRIVVAYDGVSQRIIPRQLENHEILTHHQISARSTGDPGPSAKPSPCRGTPQPSRPEPRSSPATPHRVEDSPYPRCP